MSGSPVQVVPDWNIAVSCHHSIAISSATSSSRMEKYRTHIQQLLYSSTINLSGPVWAALIMGARGERPI